MPPKSLSLSQVFEEAMTIRGLRDPAIALSSNDLASDLPAGDYLSLALSLSYPWGPPNSASFYYN